MVSDRLKKTVKTRHFGAMNDGFENFEFIAWMIKNNVYFESRVLKIRVHIIHEDE